jgi:hypothetical protein
MKRSIGWRVRLEQIISVNGIYLAQERFPLCSFIYME